MVLQQLPLDFKINLQRWPFGSVGKKWAEGKEKKIFSCILVLANVPED